MAIVLAVFGVLLFQNSFSPARAAGSLKVEVLAGYNLVVDSNVTSPSTYAPSVATVAGKFCNTGDAPLTNVIGKIGDYGSLTAGQYPARSTSDPGFLGEHPLLDIPYSYRFTHLGATSDAIRYIGALQPGQCSVQYWSFTYPSCEGGQTPPCSNNPVWGRPTDPIDDLYLYFDIWGQADGGPIANQRWKMTMRNEISAMANKIEPNPNGAWFNTDTNIVNAGDVITTNGIRYTFGNVNKGFDNDNDGLFDYNAWMQPFGAPTYDPSCFRLIRTSGVLTVTRSGGNPPMVVNFVDQLYFTNLPKDNTSVTGNVYYTFLALGGVCTTAMSPYQEAASGADNEKFNGDFGTGIPPLLSYAPAISLEKNGPSAVAENVVYSYEIPFFNTGDTDIGLTLSSNSYGVNMPFTIQDKVPTGLEYVCGSAGVTLEYAPSSPPGYTILYSKDGGLTYNTSEASIGCPTNPTSSLANPIVIRWQLTDPLPKKPNSGTNTSGGKATFQAKAPSGYLSGGGSPFIVNDVCANLGGASLSLECARTTTMINGSGTITGYIWRDEDNNGSKSGEAGYGINAVSVYLYWDKNGDGKLDDQDELVAMTTSSGTTDTNYSFTGLPTGPAADFLVVVEKMDSDIPDGYRITTPSVRSVQNLAGASTGNDFGFGPVLDLVKRLVSPNSSGDGGLATFTISLINQQPGDGTANGFCRYDVWAGAANQGTGDTPAGGNAANAQWANVANALGNPNDTYAVTTMNDNSDLLGLKTFTQGAQLGVITKVEYILYVKEVSNLKSSDSLVVRVYHNNNPISNDTNHTYTGGSYFTGPTGAQYIIVSDITSLRSWTFSDFAGGSADTEMQLEASKGSGGGDSGDIGLDAAGFRIYTDQKCASEDNIITTLPLTDTFDADLMSFYASVPAPNAVAASGAPNNTIGNVYWDNLGPLYPGQTKVITITFRLNEPSPDPAQNINNVWVKNALFGNGRKVNDDSDNVEITRQSITGYVWADVATFGWANNTTGFVSPPDTFIPNATVELWGCVNKTSNLLITTPGATNQPCTHNSNNGEWRLIATDKTDSTGKYLFAGLDEGFYYLNIVESTLPPGYIRTAEAGQSATNQNPLGIVNGRSCGTCDGVWGDPTAALNTTNFNQLTFSEDIQNVNFGYTVPAMVYGYLWNDMDGDGKWDPDEPPLAGVTVERFNGTCTLGVNCPTATTNSDGYYVFYNVPVGASNYVRVRTTSLPSGGAWQQTFDPDYPASLPCSGAQCDNRNNNFSVLANRVYGAYNFGYTQTGVAALGDWVWRDSNGNGLQDSGEEGIAGLKILLYRDYDQDGQIDPLEFYLETTTDANGYYIFDNLPDGSYIIQIPYPPTDMIPSYDPDGVKDHVARKIVISNTGTVVTFNGVSCTVNNNTCRALDFGYQLKGTGTVGDTIWFDINGNGSQEAGEPGIAGVLVNLYEDLDGDGLYTPGVDSQVATTTTLSGGSYIFRNLAEGKYVVVVAESNFSSGQPLHGLVQSNGSQNSQQTVDLEPGENYRDADFGYTSSSLGGTIWKDFNGNGNLDFNEPGISGVQILLYRSSDGGNIYTAFQTTSTDAKGEYLFTGLAPGNYKVIVGDGVDVNYTLTYDPDAYSTNPAKPFPPCNPSDPDYIKCDEESITYLQIGYNDRSHDFGYQPKGNIGDTLWIDLNSDGMRQINEPGVPWVNVKLCSDQVCSSTLATTTTDSQGNYSFGNLNDGVYYVAIDTSDPDYSALGLTPTYEKNDSTPDNNTKVVISAGSVASINDVSCSNCAMDVDFGYQVLTTNNPNTISGVVYFDNNNNGALNIPGDNGLEGITVFLRNNNGMVIAATTTNNSGAYSFTNLPNGTYTVVIDTNQPQMLYFTQTDDPDDPTPFTKCEAGDNCNNRTTITLNGGTTSANNNFGYYANMDCGDLPNSYNYRTKLVSEGPCHVWGVNGIPTNYLGSKWDTDPDGQGGDSLARGDDLDGNPNGNDEDGVVVINYYDWMPGTTQQVRVTVVGDNSYLAAWFDWNADGNFVDLATGEYDPGEYIYFGAVSPGVNVLDIAIPECPSTCFANDFINNPDRQLFFRFRLYRGSSPPPIVAPTGNVQNGEVEDFIVYDTPTAVTLSSFELTSQFGQIILNWATILEFENRGFNVYRATNPDGPMTLINADIIPSQTWTGESLSPPFYYQFIDTDVQPGVVYYYWLEEISVSGEPTLYGPEQVVNPFRIFLPALKRQ